MGIAIAMLILLACIIIGGFLSIKVYNSEDAERYTKQRMQGSFVPVDAQEPLSLTGTAPK